MIHERAVYNWILVTVSDEGRIILLQGYHNSVPPQFTSSTLYVAIRGWVFLIFVLREIFHLAIFHGFRVCSSGRRLQEM
jgi:hypothetical protein